MPIPHRRVALLVTTLLIVMLGLQPYSTMARTVDRQNDQRLAQDVTCDPHADLSAWFVTNSKGAIYNKSETCSYDVGMASYEKYDEVIDHQKYFDSDTATVGPKEKIYLNVGLPNCAAQIDLFYGPVLQSLDGQRYGSRLLSARHVGGTNYCGTYPTETPTETETATPTATETETATPTATETETATPTATETETATPTNTETATPTATETATPTVTETETATPTATETPTSTATETPTSTATETPTSTATETPTSTATETPTSTATETPTSTATETPTSTATETPTGTPVGENCTYTIGYWKNHPNDWPVMSLTIGGVTYNQTQLLNILDDKTPDGAPASPSDATYNLAKQLIGAMLNVANGADDSSVADTITDANQWLMDNPLGSNPKGATRDEGLGYKTILDEYNNGLIGPGHCGNKVQPVWSGDSFVQIVQAELMAQKSKVSTSNKGAMKRGHCNRHARAMWSGKNFVQHVTTAMAAFKN